MKGSDFAKQMEIGFANGGVPKASASALKTILAGNVPEFTKARIGCTTSAVIDGKFYEMLYFVSPSYLAIGEDSDFVTWPLSILDLQAYCNASQIQYVDSSRVGPAYFLPTKKLLGRTWEFAPYKIMPQFMWYDKIGDVGGVSSIRLVAMQQAMINEALGKWNGPDGTKTGAPLRGFNRSKKAYIAAPDASLNTLRFWGWYFPGNALKRGWQSANPASGMKGYYTDSTGKYGEPKQNDSIGGSPGHDPGYGDYSHGCDFVHADTYINGMAVPYDEGCMDPKFNVLYSGEGPFNPIYPNFGLPKAKALAKAPPPMEVPSGFNGPKFVTVSNNTTKLVQPPAPVYYRPIADDNPAAAEQPSSGFPWGPVLVGSAAVALFWATLGMRRKPA